MPGGKRLYSITDVHKAFGNDRRLPESTQKAKTAQAIQKFQKGSNETSSRQDTTHSPFSHSEGMNETQAMDRNSSMDIQSMPYRGRKRRRQTKKERPTGSMP
ncbi:41811_t:CDS:2 [Gigaspora margarita]|uniref:41811_t:CDS:1 n=1 Tax=Gigaspora margarita TaxID=4874 RepID=A0ABN7UJL4_GIGMA|nr:41811_t:CDS:2 [Gigaspora margarita]